ncbi:hypothetical protein AMELA_G00211040 [Ameiurus melas]|uniref:FUN14 domain-containing protein 2 n=1 Tax=Ameiurus melas TaxID=219545 RepID=A0A7J6A4B2_AMEME|nr:hypothetical protein AMELA_G00211040 [Ameiurus melas]
MAGKKKDSETFDVIDLAEQVKKQRWWNKMFGNNSGPAAEKYSVATQLAIGGVTGWCAGYLFQKVGKVAASAVGGGFFLLQLNAEKPTKEVKTKVQEVQTFVKKNLVLSGGFVGGFLLGLAS